MKLILRATPDPGETAPALETIGEMGEADWLFLLEMLGSLYDESESKQDTNTNGELLFIAGDGSVVTQAEVAAQMEVRADADTVFTPKYRPRTMQEVHAKIAAGLTKGAWASALKRKEELEARIAQAAARSATVPATPVTPAG